MGRMTSWYLPRLKVSRMRSATLQMKLTISLWFIGAGWGAECGLPDRRMATDMEKVDNYRQLYTFSSEFAPPRLLFGGR